ncbi:hypothetical protein IE53DRAFT_51899 [Violaceomyces palustris]|uniref:Uncharacterized protein n=1 Tax=Violaceomyces palustris TaxID=1673888 RepID=A0ACD0P088_9BASI|nr:hypothetical protein IE53DRAFT_51899 [Violaceomyces palustris]
MKRKRMRKGKEGIRVEEVEAGLGGQWREDGSVSLVWLWFRLRLRPRTHTDSVRLDNFASDRRHLLSMGRGRSRSCFGFLFFVLLPSSSFLIHARDLSLTPSPSPSTPTPPRSATTIHDIRIPANNPTSSTH